MEIRPLLLGHRGVRGEKSIPENSVASFDHALSLGCDGFEFDVRLSADDQAVICHDAASHGCEIAACPAQQLGLPILGDVLARYHGRAFLDLELKVAGAERITVNLLAKFPPARGFVISSFLPAVLQTTHSLDETLPLGLICETRAQLARWRELPVEYVMPQYQLVGQDTILEIKNAGKKILVWTVNAVDDMKRFCEWEVDGIISDNPKLLASKKT